MKTSTILFYDDSYLNLLHDPWFKSGGATKQVVAWVEGLREMGVTAKVAGAHSNEAFFRNYDHTTISYDPARGIPKLRYLYVRIPGIVKAMTRSGAAYVYYGIPSPFAGILAICARLTGRRFILRVSNDLFVDERARGQFDLFRYIWFSLGFRLADHILCQNNYQFTRIEKAYPGKAAKIANPYVGTVVKEIRPFGDRKHVAWVGIFQRQKNLPLLVDIVRRLPELEFRVAGGHDKALSEADQEALGALRALPNVRLVGFLDRQGVLDLLDQSYLLLNTSHYEGFSNTYLEAFSRGTPVFSPIQNDPDEIIQKNDLGEVYSGGGAAEDQIRQFCMGSASFDRTSRNCVGYMRARHDLAALTRDFIRIIGWKERSSTRSVSLEADRVA